MAGLNLPWLAASIATLMALALPLGLCLRGSLANRLVGYQAVSVGTALLFVEMAYAFGQSSSIELALTLGLLSLPGTALLAIFVERWL